MPSMSPSSSSSSTSSSLYDSSDSSITSSSNSSSNSNSDNSSLNTKEEKEKNKKENNNFNNIKSSVFSKGVNSSSSSSFSSNVSKTVTGICRVQLNPELIFKESDAAWIDIPSGSDHVLRRIVTNYENFPEGRYRIIDYFRTAVEMFITQLRQEYTQQYQQAQRNKKIMNRFIWRNKGELAICFAACCDMVKLLFDRCRPGPDKPNWDTFVHQFLFFIMTESRIPQHILTEQTYHTKYLDWRKGGTRYQGEQLAANVRFPSAEERRRKIETYLCSGAGYNIESITVVETPALASTSRTISNASNTSNNSSNSSSNNNNNNNSIPPLVGFPRGQGPVKMPVKLQIKVPPSLVAGKQAVDEYRHLQWLAKLTQILGGSPTLEFPEERSHMILAFVRFCETSEMPDHFITIMNILIKSSEKIQDIFERGGGIVVLRRFVGSLVRLKDDNGLINFIDKILQMKISAWGHSSQQSWLRDLLGNSGKNLKWMRTLDIIPTEKQTTWDSLVSALEQRYVLSTSREEEYKQGVKRARIDTKEALIVSLADNVGVNKPVPCISTDLCISLPVEFCAPPLSSNIEQDTISFLNKKLQYCKDAQISWRETILKALDGKFPDLPIPLWYDPYQLLGVDPYPTS